VIYVIGALYFLIPLAATFYWSLRAEKDTLGLEAYRRLFADTNFLPSFSESIVNAVAAIVISLLIIVPTAYWVTLRLPKLRPVVEFITLLPFVIPAVVVETAVSLAGPLANFILVIILGALFKFGAVPVDPNSLLSVSLAFLLHLQVSAIVLNMLPVPPLDGFGALAPWLSEAARQTAYRNTSVTFFVLFIALSFVPVINRAFWETVFAINSLLGVPPELVRVGWNTYRFWD
jgi:ABC-type spermidine/putrescine transport system permease subunit I